MKKNGFHKPLFAAAMGLCLVGFASPAAAAPYKAAEVDTLWTIAQAFHTNVELIRAANPGIDPLNLQGGQLVELPKSVRTYSATDKDTFWLLAERLKLNVNELLRLNPNVDPLNVHAGVQIVLPQTPAQPQSGKGQQAAGNAKAENAKADRAKADRAKAEKALAEQATAGKATAQQAIAAKPIAKPAAPARQDATITTPSGESLAYSRMIPITATAYSAAPEENGWGPVDYFGAPLKVGTIAVDPNVIPLNSTVYVTGYRFDGLPAGGMIAKATDTGSAVKGNRVDIFVDGARSYVSDFGFQNVKVYVLK